MSGPDNYDDVLMETEFGSSPVGSKLSPSIPQVNPSTRTRTIISARPVTYDRERGVGVRSINVAALSEFDELDTKVADGAFIKQVQYFTNDKLFVFMGSRAVAGASSLQRINLDGSIPASSMDINIGILFTTSCKCSEKSLKSVLSYRLA